MAGGRPLYRTLTAQSLFPPANFQISKAMTTFAPEQYKETLIFLTTAGVVVPLFRRLKVSPILGFLGAGVLLGPYGIGALGEKISWLAPFAFGNVEQIAPVAEFGVVFLLFMIGLELSWARLALIGKLVFGLGALQVFGSAAVLGGVALLLHETPVSAAVIGLALALSSTAIVIPVLAESKRLGTTAGRTIFAVLLFQDLMVAPLLFMVTMLGAQAGGLGMAVVSTLIPAITGLSVIVIGGRIVMRPLFRHVAAAGSTEFFMAACLLVVIGTGVVTAISGLSMGLGAFIAGILLAETEYNREIEVTIEPFKGLLLGLFFVSIGASLDFSQVFSAPVLTFDITVGVILIKFCVNWVAGWILRLPGRISTEAALMLAPGGEFAFVIITAAVAAKALPAASGAEVMVAVTLSMFAVPPLGILAQRFAGRRSIPDVTSIPEADHPAPDAIIIGFGRVGQLVGDMLHTHAIRYVAVDTHPGVVKRLRSEGRDIYWGNASRPEFLERCGLGKAKALIITMDKPSDTEDIVRDARTAHPGLTIVARARDAQHATALYALGVSDAVPETIEASLQLSEAVLVDMGVPMGKVIASIHEKRDEFRKLLQPGEDHAKARRAIKMSLRMKEMKKRQEKLNRDE
ncbi:cation:proton antiporter [Methylocapsa sp. D3K7]|uniref:cation:proton antiporter domain-containing protein n=1 Tax=Methylocapsa sp. D3K7 TaxID=3041435 RepID=UPI00244EEC9B|nr:cation:proton antiporter [Methylocapsa sp. D3K7]WGJ15994.1 cation:proton antiporter [Methylocapsa sp. D3K7]